ncbi:MAG: hypothetical protein B7733_16580 [Myxococcales bacterium FL481]|nr:MAG: hypothetical protein B7733_16580 [Myxococcales bacterium FL481]
MWSGHSTTALLAMLLCVPVSMFLVFAMRPVKGATMAILGSMLLLPERAYFDIGPIPNLDKFSLPYVAVFLACCLRCPGRVLRLPRERWMILIVIGIVVGGLGTALTNPEALPSTNGEAIRGLTPRDGVAQALRVLLDVVLPLVLGAALFTKVKEGEELFLAIASAAVLYSVFLLYEARMSPQMHNIVYGYSPIVTWGQTYRWGGHRPNVFLAHGLALAIFVYVALGCAVTLARRRRPILSLSPGFVSFYLAAMLGMCRCTASIIYGVVSLPLWLYASPGTMTRVARVLALVVLAYPALRVDVLPPDGLMEWLLETAPDRHESMAFRLRAEDLVLEHVEQKPWFGWGSFGRNYSPKDPFGILDGFWIITLGLSGWVGFYNVFLPLVLPVFLTSARLRKFKSPADRRFLATTSVILVVATVDLLPNGLFTNLVYLLAGALSGISAGHRASNRDGFGGGPDPRLWIAALPELFVSERVTQTGGATRASPSPGPGRRDTSPLEGPGERSGEPVPEPSPSSDRPRRDTLPITGPARSSRDET